MHDLIVIVGPTASGKTALGAGVAAAVGGEVVSADAFAVYRELDIGTAKPSREVRECVRHHLVDVADPRATYSAGMFVRDADCAITQIQARGRIPVVVGGTHFYVRALLFGLFPEPPKDAALRRGLEGDWERNPEAVRVRLRALDPDAAARILPGDRQRTLRALEVCISAGRPMTELWREHPLTLPRYRFQMLGLSLPRGELHARIAKRVELMFASGLPTEVERLLAGGVRRDAHAMKAIGYRECCGVVFGEWSEAEAREKTVVATRRLAKRQLTWLRAEREVSWLSGDGEGCLREAVLRVEERGGTDSRTA
jgi:tRNA dimethylallyltransferase